MKQNPCPSVRFLAPILMECSAEEALTLADHLQDFDAMGIEIDPVGENDFCDSIDSFSASDQEESQRRDSEDSWKKLAFEQPEKKGRSGPLSNPHCPLLPHGHPG